MTATIDETTQEQVGGAVGRVARVTGPVVDVEFAADNIPNMYNALKVELEIGDTKRTLTLEVDRPVRRIECPHLDLSGIRFARIDHPAERRVVPRHLDDDWMSFGWSGTPFA